ncbi:hypothetical protein PHSY_003838 [Pseudozyma hubeiensis SY62]|uniref:WKF domain-containing protein n=1 Tax=Pseudozyma hubeiensis (strain SY62) TaxID=1305764 RepID=R9P499_PSEHS|nr:hypothetical protein PHSY_003838 [Pseudozyma hubeiensis SY62]GAC96258.1 hypothetical protein PHSY_003838 [Pseudozyma hubeiensis SY62]
MSAAAAINQAGPSTPASKDKKPKRTRKRNKRRTLEVEDSSSSSDDSSDDEDVLKVKAAPVETPKSSTKKAKVDSDSESDSDSGSDEDQKDDGEGKRKRKRKRTQKKKPTQPSSESIASTPSTASKPSAPKPISLSPEDVGPDPNTDLRLSDQAKQAIQYAQIYIKDKSQWKFNKAKQNWLLRNALSVPPSDYDASLARKQVETSSAAEDSEDAAEEGENFVPEDFVPVVTAYLTSVMGGARLRLIESLREAINAPVVEIAPTQPEAQDDSAHTTTANEQAAGIAAGDGGATTKSVSFGNLALESEQKEQAAEAAGLPAGTDPREVEMRRERATKMLGLMGEVL